MDVGLFSPRSNVPVGGGPNGLTSWFVVTSDPTGLVRKPAGTVAFHVDGIHAWWNADGTAAGWYPWATMAALAALSARGDFRTLATPAPYFGVLVPVPAQPWKVILIGTVPSAAATTIGLMFNGSAVGFSRSWFSGAIGSALAVETGVDGNVALVNQPAGGAANQRVTVTIACEDPVGFAGMKGIDIRTWFPYTPVGPCVRFGAVGWANAAQVTEVGFRLNVGNWAAGASLRVVPL